MVDEAQVRQPLELVREPKPKPPPDPEIVEQIMWMTLELTQPQVYALAAAVQNSSDPFTLDKAYNSPEAKKWRAATDKEYHSLIKNTWTLMDTH